MEVLHPAFRASDAKTILLGLESLAKWAGASGEADRGSTGGTDPGTPMSGEELERLAQSELIELGAHTSNHLSIPAQGGDVQRDEVGSSREFLADLTGRPPASFSYPFGDNDPASRRVVRSFGFENAVGIGKPTPLTGAARRFELPRLIAVQEGEEALAARMESALAFREIG
jgi:peptidoglycan/xylan/chitin deacetylase (PgdA/CDA1 family)